jgi:PAS domain S-box-containing protein
VTSPTQAAVFAANETRMMVDGASLGSKLPATTRASSQDALIVSALKELCHTDGGDHAGWFLVDKATRIIDGANFVSTAEALSTKKFFDSSLLPWCTSCLLSGRPVQLGSLADLPANASEDKTYLLRAGVRSLAMFPVEGSEAHMGVVAILCLQPVQNKRWSNSLANRCAVLGSAFLSTRSKGFLHLPKDANFREAFRTAPVGMAIEDLSGGLLYVNDALCGMLGYLESDLLRKRCADFSHPEDLERERALFAQLLTGERQSYEIEKRFLHRDGSIVWGKVNITLLRDDSRGAPLVLGMVEDITSRKAALESLASSKLEVQALAYRIMLSQEDQRRMIARELHDDIGQRLSLLTSEIHLLHSTRQGKPQSAALVRLKDELDTLVTDLHDLSHRLHSSKLQHLGVRFTLREVCQRFAHVGLSIDLTCDEDLGIIPEDIGICLIRITEEALNNVLKHSGVSQASVTVTQQLDGYRLVIRDAGQGFVAGAAEQGLGLISMRERVRSLKGSMHLSWRRNGGTEIAIWLPLHQAARGIDLFSSYAEAGTPATIARKLQEQAASDSLESTRRLKNRAS